MRQYGEVLPVPPSNAPAVLSTTGLGTGGGAGVVAQVGQSGWGHVHVRTGSNPGTSGNLDLRFPVAPPNLFISADEAFGPLNISGQGTTDILIAWTADSFQPNHSYRINYEWASSR